MFKAVWHGSVTNRKSFSFSVPDVSMYYQGQEFTDLDYMKNYYIDFLS